MDEAPAELPRCTAEGCGFVVRANSKHPVNTLRTHQRSAHEGWTDRRRQKKQFAALIAATGSFDHARFFAPHVILGTLPGPKELTNWAIEAEVRDDADNPMVSQRDIERMERKVRKVQEWDARKTNAINRQVLQTAGGQFLEGKISLQDMGTSYRYAGDNWHWGEKAVKEAYAQTVPQQTGNFQQIVINAGQNPHIKKKELSSGKPAVDPNIIDAEVREIVDHGDG